MAKFLLISLLLGVLWTSANGSPFFFTYQNHLTPADQANVHYIQGIFATPFFPKWGFLQQIFAYPTATVVQTPVVQTPVAQTPTIIDTPTVHTSVVRTPEVSTTVAQTTVTKTAVVQKPRVKTSTVATKAMRPRRPKNGKKRPRPAKVSPTPPVSSVFVPEPVSPDVINPSIDIRTSFNSKVQIPPRMPTSKKPARKQTSQGNKTTKSKSKSKPKLTSTTPKLGKQISPTPKSVAQAKKANATLPMQKTRRPQTAIMSTTPKEADTIGPAPDTFALPAEEIIEISDEEYDRLLAEGKITDDDSAERRRHRTRRKYRH